MFLILAGRADPSVAWYLQVCLTACSCSLCVCLRGCLFSLHACSRSVCVALFCVISFLYFYFFLFFSIAVPFRCTTTLQHPRLVGGALVPLLTPSRTPSHTPSRTPSRTHFTKLAHFLTHHIIALFCACVGGVGGVVLSITGLLGGRHHQYLCARHHVGRP